MQLRLIAVAGASSFSWRGYWQFDQGAHILGMKATNTLLVYSMLTVALMMPTIAFANPRTFNLRAQAATKSIPEFARQAGIQILASGSKLRGIQTPALKGQYEVRKALAILLKDTGLHVIEDDGNSITLAASSVVPSAQYRQAVGKAMGRRRVESLLEEESLSTPDGQREIVVTALHRPTNIRDTPLAISAIAPRTLDNLGITSAQDLFSAAPSLVVRQNVNGGSRMIMRSIQSAGEPTVGLYFDEAALTGSTGVNNDAGGSTPEVRLFDVERVEILRGPQGTLYGAGSMAGTVRLIFNKPNLHQYQNNAAGQVFSVAHGGRGHIIQGTMNFPIINGVLGVRAIAFHEQFGGWIDNSKLALGNFNDSKTYGGRFLLRYKPIDAVTIDGLAVYQSRRGFSNFWDYRAYSDEDRKYDQNVDTRTPQNEALRLFSSTINWELPFAMLTAVVAYSERDLTSRFNLSPLLQRDAQKSSTAPGCLAYFGLSRSGGGMCTPSQMMAYADYVDSMLPLTTLQPQTTKTASQEVRLANNGARFKWTLGFYHSHRKNIVRSMLGTANPLTGQLEPGFRINLDRRVEDFLQQYAGFAESTFDVTEALSLTMGLRYFQYRKRTDSEVAVGNVAIGTVTSPASSNHATESGIVSNFNVKYIISPEIMTYVSATQGFRPGGVNQIVGLSSDLATYASTYRSDSLWNYELGIKVQRFDRTFVLDFNIFQIDWSNIQVGAGTIDDIFIFVTNAGKVRARGAEFETVIQPFEGMTMRAAGSYNSAKLRGDQVGPPGIIIQGAGRDGDHVPYTSKWTYQASAEYLIPISRQLNILVFANLSYLGSSWIQFAREGSDRYLHRLPATTFAGLRVGVQSNDGRWGLHLSIDNVLNEVGIVNKVHSGSQDRRQLYAVGTKPRTLGINFRSSF
jgi:outer membrane receptor protein involved in Fe transport